MQIPLGTQQGVDNLIWPYEKHGRYAVESGAAETLLHAVWKCGSAKEIWGSTGWAGVHREWKLMEFKDLWIDEILSGNKEDRNYFAMLVWSIWAARCEDLFDGEKCSHVIRNRARNLLDFQDSNKIDQVRDNEAMEEQ
ncbi:hypothetical protein ACFX13_036014 [Malus domestica]